MIEIIIGKIASLVIAFGYAAVATIAGGLQGLECSVVLLLPLALIWFADEIGEATGYMAGNYTVVDTPTPAILISIAGWFFLLGLPVVVYLASR